MRVIVAGSRGFNDYRYLENFLDDTFGDTITCIISGKCKKGADALGERYANKRGIPVDPYPADWDRWGRSAGIRRNKIMVENSNADALVAFWDGVSRGTKNVIEEAEKHGLKIWIVDYLKNNVTVIYPSNWKGSVHDEAPFY